MLNLTMPVCIVLWGEVLSRTGSCEPVTNSYDGKCRLIGLTDGNSHTTLYSYNTAGYLASMTYPGGQTVQFAQHNPNGQLLKRIDGHNVETDYTYNDPENRLTNIHYPATPALDVQFTYDSFGRRATMTDSTGAKTYSYDDGDRPLSVATTFTGLPTKTLGFSYYPDGSGSSESTPAGNFSTLYDAGGRPFTFTNPFSETTTFSFAANNWQQSQTLANGVSSRYSYTARGMLSRLQNFSPGSATLADFGGTAGMQYDSVGNRTSVSANVPASCTASGSTSYTLDGANELTQEQSGRNGGYTNNFGYDSAFNPTTFRRAAHTFNTNNQDTGQTYDGNGNPGTLGAYSLTFDPENRLTAVGTLLTAGYDGDNIRAWKQDGLGNRTYYLGPCELDSSGNVIATNTFGPTGLLSRHTAAGSVFYTFDGQGNVSQRTDSAGNVLSTSVYDAFGQKLSTDPQSDPWGYHAEQGYYTDAETGLILCTHRYYDPGAGRWLNRDPIGYGGGINLYGYVGKGGIWCREP